MSCSVALRGAASIVACVTLLVACATPAVKLDRQAAHSGLDVLEVEGAGFLHRAYRKAGGGGPLHVYLEGDGLPWATPTRIAADPHPRHALGFDLMLLDPAPALYLGRPCYQRLRATDACHPGLWTDQRYSQTVVESLEAALRELIEPLPPLVLIGYSGGGVLAMLLAERLETTVAVVTLAANLDVASWTEHHGYTPLAGSLDPALRSPLPASIKQWHLVGGRDSNVPPSLIESFVQKQPTAEVIAYPELDHACCWAGVWRDVLRRLAVEEGQEVVRVSGQMPQGFPGLGRVFGQMPQGVPGLGESLGRCPKASRGWESLWADAPRLPGVGESLWADAPRRPGVGKSLWADAQSIGRLRTRLRANAQGVS